MDHAPNRGLSLHTKIFLGLLLGAIVGLTVNALTPSINEWGQMIFDRENYDRGRSSFKIVDWILTNIVNPVGQIFLRLLLMTVIPLVFCSLVAGVAKLGELRSLGRIGLKTFSIFVITMTIAVVIGLALINSANLGGQLPREIREELMKTYARETAEKAKAAQFGVETFVNIVPRNPIMSAAQMDMLGVITFALLFGIGLTQLDSQRRQKVLEFLESVSDIMVWMINLAMQIAPYGVFAFICTVTARFGLDLLQQLFVYIAIVIGGIGIQMFIVLSLLLVWLGRVNPLLFFQRSRNILITAFSTSSSNATLPTSIRTSEEELGIPPQIAGFVLPLGATMNMNGTALFEGVTVIFLAQVFGIELTLSQQVIVVILSMLTAIGAAGVPGGSLPLLVMVLTTVGVPAEALGIILGVDRLLDMCRTTLNVMGDVVTATIVARSEGYAVLETVSDNKPSPPA